MRYTTAWQEIAKEADCNYLTLSRFYRGTQTPRADLFERICTAVERRLTAPTA